jgi:hypothetical protein
LKIILESVDKELSSDKDCNMSLLNENEPTQGKLYRSIKPVSRKETAAKMVEIAGTREASDEPQSQKDVTTWQMRLSELDQYLTEMFEFFLPAAYPDKVSGKYFGAVMYLLKVIFLWCVPVNQTKLTCLDNFENVRAAVCCKCQKSWRGLSLLHNRHIQDL